MLYLNTNGGNPDGSVMSEQRIKDIYEVASEYNLLIIEDDPYYYLNYKVTDVSLLSMYE